MSDQLLKRALASSVSMNDVMAMFRITRMTAEYYRREHGMPFFKVGSFVRCDKEELSRWIERKKYKLPSVGAYVQRLERADKMGRRGANPRRERLDAA